MKLIAEQSNLVDTEEIEEKNEYQFKIFNRDDSETTSKEETEVKEKWTAGTNSVLTINLNLVHLSTTKINGT